MIRVLIADDHQLTLAAVKSALESSDDVKVVAEANSGRMALGLIERANADVALIDMHMPGKIDGLTCAERIRKRYPQTRVVIISGFTDEAAIKMAFRRGAHAFISKAVDPKDIAPALRQAVSGTVYHAPPGDGGALETEDVPEGLSEREVTVLKAVAAGLSNAQIAKRLWVSEHTVKFHLTNVFRKLDVKNRTEAARWAHNHGLVTDVESEEGEEAPATPATAASPALAPSRLMPATA